MLQYAATQGEVAIALEALDGFKERSVRQYTTVLSGLGKAGRVEAVMDVFNRMREEKVVIDAIVASQPLMTFLEAGKYDMAADLSMRLILLKIQPDGRLYGHMLEGKLVLESV